MCVCVRMCVCGAGHEIPAFLYILNLPPSFSVQLHRGCKWESTIGSQHEPRRELAQATDGLSKELQGPVRATQSLLWRHDTICKRYGNNPTQNTLPDTIPTQERDVLCNEGFGTTDLGLVAYYNRCLPEHALEMDPARLSEVPQW